MSLRFQFLKYIIPPLLLGTIFTSVLSSFIILQFTPRLIDNAQNDIFSNEFHSLRSLSKSISESLALFFQNGLSHVQQTHRFGEMIKKGSVETILNPTYKNVLNISRDPSILDSFETYDKETQADLGHSGWFMGLNISDESSLSNQSRKNLHLSSQYDIIMRAAFSSNNYTTKLYTIFDDDGLFYQYPLKNETYFLTFRDESPCPYTESGQQDYYEPRCRKFYKDIKAYVYSKYYLSSYHISFPYLFANQKSVGITVCAISLKSSDQISSFDIIDPPSYSRKMDHVICGDYDLSLFQTLLAELVKGHHGYYYVVSPFKNGIVYHSAIDYTSGIFNNSASLTELEFGVNDEDRNQEALEFNNTILPQINVTYRDREDWQKKKTGPNGEDLEMKIFYYKKGVKMLVSLSPMFLEYGDESTYNSHVATIVYVASGSDIITQFNETKSNLERTVIFQIALFFIVNIIILYFFVKLIDYIVNSIVNPIEDLGEVVNKIVNDDLNTDVTRNFTPQSAEINELYQTFSKLKFVMKYANSELFEGNDAQALIDYSMALKLYKDLNNINGMGIALNNIGNIHFKNERFDEAIACYREAVHFVEKNLNDIYKSNPFQQTLLIKKAGDSGTLSARVNMTKSRRRIDRNKLNKENFDVEKLEQLYANRLYQLANALIMQSSKMEKEENWPEVIYILEKIIRTDSHLEKNISRIIDSLVKLSHAYLHLGNHEASFKYLQEAEESVEIYEKVELLCNINPKLTEKVTEDDLDLAKNVSNILTQKEKFVDSHADVLRQRVLFQYGVFYEKMGRFKEASTLFTRCLETGKIYEPSIRVKCLEHLSTIFASQNILEKAPNITKILNRLQSKKDKEVILLLDYSESMGEGARIQYAIKSLMKIFDLYLKPQDKIGFIRFNLNCESVFNLREKRINTIQLRRQIENSMEPFGGSALYDAIRYTLKEFKKYKPKENSKWIVAVTDGEDNSSKNSYNVIKKKLQLAHVNLIVIGVGLNKDFSEKMANLCRSTKQGIFIENPNNLDLDVAFQAITEIKYEQEYIVEAF